MSELGITKDTFKEHVGDFVKKRKASEDIEGEEDKSKRLKSVFSDVSGFQKRSRDDDGDDEAGRPKKARKTKSTIGSGRPKRSRGEEAENKNGELKRQKRK